MTIRTRIHDLLPVILAFAIVAAVATWAITTWILAVPLEVPPPKELPPGQHQHQPAAARSPERP